MSGKSARMYGLYVETGRSEGLLETIDDGAYNILRACIHWLQLGAPALDGTRSRSVAMDLRQR